nr:MAG TPA: hypothetical protein [Caudoviricetes sp.]
MLSTARLRPKRSAGPLESVARLGRKSRPSIFISRF